MLSQKDIEEILKFIGPRDGARLTKKLVDVELKKAEKDDITSPSEE